MDGGLRRHRTVIGRRRCDDVLRRAQRAVGLDVGAVKAGPVLLDVRPRVSGAVDGGVRPGGDRHEQLPERRHEGDDTGQPRRARDATADDGSGSHAGRSLGERGATRQ
jgi:hypothetical protein